nr:hypothetical protein [Streptococcus parasanguinis]
MESGSAWPSTALIVGNGVAASSILVAALRRNILEPPRRPSPACRMARLIASYTDELFVFN